MRENFYKNFCRRATVSEVAPERWGEAHPLSLAKSNETAAKKVITIGEPMSVMWSDKGKSVS